MPNLLTVEELAGVLKRSPQAVRCLRQRGVLPSAVRVGRRIYWHESDITAMLEKRDEKHKAEHR